MGREPYEPHSSKTVRFSRTGESRPFLKHDPSGARRTSSDSISDEDAATVIKANCVFRGNGSARSLNKLVLFLPSIYIGATVGQSNQQNEIA